MKTNTLEKCFVYVDANAHYIPVIGTVVAIIGIFEKYVVLSFVRHETIVNSYYFSYLSNKSLDAFLLTSVPVLGSIIIHQYGKSIDYTKNQNSLLQAMKKDPQFLQYADLILLRNPDCMLNAIEIDSRASFS